MKNDYEMIVVSELGTRSAQLECLLQTFLPSIKIRCSGT